MEAIYNFFIEKSKQETFINNYIKDWFVLIEFWRTKINFNF